MSRMYQMPDFIARCPRKTLSINEHFLTLEEEYNQWVDAFPLFQIQERTAYKGGQLPLFVSLCFPTASLEALHAVVAHMTVIIFLDHANDTASVEDAQKNTALYIAAFDDPAAGLESTDRFTRFISSLAMRATAVIGVEHRLYYRQEYVALARATAQEAVERQTAEVDKVMLTLQTYWLTRRYSVGTRSFFGYIRAVNGLKIPEQLWDDPTVQALGHAATDVTIITNDILSYKKELIEDGAPHNILTILMHDPSIACSDLQQAIDYASNLFDEALDRFNECRAELQDSPDLRRYADGIADYFVGKLEWEMSSPRYNVFESEEDRKNLVLKL